MDSWQGPTLCAATGVHRWLLGEPRRVVAWRKVDDWAHVGYDCSGEPAVVEDRGQWLRDNTRIPALDLASISPQGPKREGPDQEPDGTLCFFPWLELREVVDIAGYRLIPWSVRALDQGEAVRVADHEVVANILKPYVESWTGSPRLPATATLLQLPSRALLHVPSDDEVQQAWWFGQHLAVAGLAARKPFDQGSDWGAGNFELVMQGFRRDLTGVAYRRRSRFGSTLVGAMRRDWRCQRPQHLTSGQVSVDVQLAQLLASADKAVTGADQARLRDAVLHFNLANSNRDDVHEGAELAWLVAAFERLLGLHDGKEAEFVAAVSRAVCATNCVSAASSQRLAANPMLPIKKNPRGASLACVARAWACSFYRQRNDHAHGNRAARNQTWSAFEHLALAAVLFPLLLEQALRRGDFGRITPATDSDRAAKVADKIAEFEMIADDWFAAQVFTGHEQGFEHAAGCHWGVTANALVWASFGRKKFDRQNSSDTTGGEAPC